MIVPRALISGLAAAGLLTAPATAAGVQRDPSFGTKGRATVDLPGSRIVQAALPLPSGKVIVSGYRRSRGFVARITAGGKLDRKFGNQGVQDVLDGNVALLARQPDGSILTLAQVTTDGGLGTDVQVRRITSNGRPDPTFGSRGVATINRAASDQIHAMAVTKEGRILLAGAVSDGSFDSRRGVLIRLNRNGRPDRAFATGGVYTADRDLRSVVETPGGDLLVAGTGVVGTEADFLAGNPVGDDLAVHRLNRNGRPVPGWGAAGTRVLPRPGWQEPSELTMTPTGGALLAAEDVRFAPTGGGRTGFVVRLSPRGAHDPRFRASAAGRMLAEGDGGVLVGADAVSGPARAGGRSTMTVTRLRKDGSKDPRIMRLAHAGDHSESLLATARRPKGRVLVIGQSSDAGKPEVVLYRLRRR